MKTRFGILFVFAIIALGVRIAYVQSRNWEVVGVNGSVVLSGDDDSCRFVIPSNTPLASVIRVDYFQGLHPTMGGDDYPAGVSPVGTLSEGEVDYLLFEAPRGRLLLHSYTMTDDSGRYGADILEFRPSAMSISDILSSEYFALIPDQCNPAWISIDTSKSGDVYMIQSTDGIVTRLIWKIPN